MPSRPLAPLPPVPRPAIGPVLWRQVSCTRKIWRSPIRIVDSPINGQGVLQGDGTGTVFYGDGVLSIVPKAYDDGNGNWGGASGGMNGTVDYATGAFRLSNGPYSVSDSRCAFATRQSAGVSQPG